MSTSGALEPMLTGDSVICRECGEKCGVVPIHYGKKGSVLDGWHWRKGVRMRVNRPVNCYVCGAYWEQSPNAYAAAAIGHKAQMIRLRNTKVLE